MNLFKTKRILHILFSFVHFSQKPKQRYRSLPLPGLSYKQYSYSQKDLIENLKSKIYN